MAYFSQAGDGKSLSDYREMVDSLYEEAEEQGYVPYGLEIDFSSIEKLAEIYKQKNNFQEAAKIYQALTEVIGEKMDYVDDSEGVYAGKFSQYLDDLLDCITKAGLEAEARRKYIKYLFDRYLQRDPDYFQDDYGAALEMLCTSDEDLRYWEELLEDRIPDEMPGEKDWHRHYQAQELISMKLYLLSRLGKIEECYALMEKHYRSSPDLGLQFAEQLLKDGDRERAVKVAEEAVAPNPAYLLAGLGDFLIKIYEDTNPEKYKETLQSLFLQSGDWKYYEQLKQSASPEEWRDRLDNILAQTLQEGLGRSKNIEIYLREGMYDQALRDVLSLKNIYTLGEYQGELASRYPEQYFNAYRELIFPFANRSMGRRHYQDVVSYLRRMKDIKGFEGDVQEIVERLRKENKRKPAFIDEIKNL